MTFEPRVERRKGVSQQGRESDGGNHFLRKGRTSVFEEQRTERKANVMGLGE